MDLTSGSLCRTYSHLMMPIISTTSQPTMWNTSWSDFVLFPEAKYEWSNVNGLVKLHVKNLKFISSKSTSLFGPSIQNDLNFNKI